MAGLMQMGSGTGPANFNGEEDPQHQADRDSERQIFGQEVGEHSPHDADRTARIDDILEQPQHLIENEQHCRQHERAQKRNRDRFGEVSVDQSDLPQF